ncbi:serine-rich adhesin for platelets-like [Procambarus clarkii]|uniref:serine-rich adhesin for platelets-like n=1 Tax=Procambarus clarkii TaxID=6728 RepID=UPI0037441E0E
MKMIEKEETVTAVTAATAAAAVVIIAEVEVATEEASASEEAAAAAEETAAEEAAAVTENGVHHVQQQQQQQQQQQRREEYLFDQFPDLMDVLFSSETNPTRGGVKNNNIYLPSTSSSNYQLISETTNLPAANLKCNYHQPNMQIEEEKETDLTYIIETYCKTGESINNDYQQLMVSFPENTISSSGLNEDAYVNQQHQLLVHEDQQLSNTCYNAPPVDDVNLYHEHSLTFLDPTVSPSTSGAGNPLPTLGLSLNTISSSCLNEDVYVNQQQQQQLLVSKDQQLSNTNTCYNVPPVQADVNVVRFDMRLQFEGEQHTEAQNSAAGTAPQGQQSTGAGAAGAAKTSTPEAQSTGAGAAGAAKSSTPEAQSIGAAKTNTPEAQSIGYAKTNTPEAQSDSTAGAAKTNTPEFMKALPASLDNGYYKGEHTPADKNKLITSPPPKFAKAAKEFNDDLNKPVDMNNVNYSIFYIAIGMSPSKILDINHNLAGEKPNARATVTYTTSTSTPAANDETTSGDSRDATSSGNPIPSSDTVTTSTSTSTPAANA